MRRRSLGGLFLTFGLALVVASCAGTATSPQTALPTALPTPLPTSLPPRQTPGIPPAPSGFRLDRAGPGLSPRLGRLLDTPRTTPLTATLAVYVAETAEVTVSPQPAPAITLTLASYADPTGALAAYNAWFAELGFMPAAERAPLDLGEQAERFDVGWPSLHAVIARAGPHFVIAEAGEAVPADRRGAILEELVRSALAGP